MSFTDDNVRTTAPAPVPARYSPPIVIKKAAPLEKSTPSYLSAFNNFVKQSEEKVKTGPPPAPRPKLFTAGPKVPVTSLQRSLEASPTPNMNKKKEKTPLALTPGLEDLVSREIESKIKLEIVEAQKPKPIPKNSITYRIVSKIVEEPETYKAMYQNLTRKPAIVEVITPTATSTSSAIILSNLTVETATTQANQRSQQMQRAQQLSHLNIRPFQPKSTPLASPHAAILKPYYADKTTQFVDKNGRMLAFADTIVQASPQTSIYVGQKPVLF